MDKPIYEGHEFEILKTRYVEQAANLRDLNHYDQRIFGGFVTIQVLLASWFATHPLDNCASKFGVVAIDFAMLVVCWNLSKSLRVRRQEIRDTIVNINEALGLYEKGIYLRDKAID